MSKVLWGPTVEEPPIQVPGTFESVPQGYSRLKQYETDFGYGQRLGSVFRKNAHHCSWEVPHAVRDFADNFKFGKPSVKPVSKEEMEEAVDATPAPEPPVEPPARAEPPARHGASPNPGPRALVKSPGTPTDTPPGSPETPRRRLETPETGGGTADPGGSARSQTAVKEGLAVARASATPWAVKIGRAVFGSEGAETPVPRPQATPESPWRSLPPGLTYNEFQRQTKGQFGAGNPVGTAWAFYKGRNMGLRR